MNGVSPTHLPRMPPTTILDFTVVNLYEQGLHAYAGVKLAHRVQSLALLVGDLTCGGWTPPLTGTNVRVEGWPPVADKDVTSER